MKEKFVQTSGSRYNEKKIQEIIENLSNLFRKPNLISKISSPKENFEFDRNKLVETATEFYKNVYIRRRPKGKRRTSLVFGNNTGESFPIIIKEEVKSILTKLKTNKSPGPE